MKNNTTLKVIYLYIYCNFVGYIFVSVILMH